MNWGYRIFALYTGFVAFMIGMVVLSVMQTDIHLISKDYYKQEIEYQKQINKMKNKVALSTDFQMRIAEDTQKQLILQFPTKVVGEILFFRPSDASMDFKVALQTNSELKQIIDSKAIQSGMWRIKLSWSDGEKEFFAERSILIDAQGKIAWVENAKGKKVD
ncbi:MAG: nitrogen fixation protein FixH [Cytophagales bacterium]|nr:MAG: nitrogen fixation protein FixH [Cytophagales bacterium]